MASVSVDADLIDAVIEGMRSRRNDVLVIDGSDPVGDDAYLMLYVDMDDPGSPGGDSGRVEQEWPNATAQTRKENGSILCAAVAFDGSDEMRGARRAAWEIVGDVLTMLWADPRMGVDGVVSTSLTGIRKQGVMTTRGAMYALMFSIDYNSRLERASA